MISQIVYSVKAILFAVIAVDGLYFEGVAFFGPVLVANLEKVVDEVESLLKERIQKQTRMEVAIEEVFREMTWEYTHRYGEVKCFCKSY